IHGISFEWNDIYASLGRSTGRREIGVIAQEIEAVFPELVMTWGEEHYKAVDYGRLTGVLVEAVKELKVTTETQQQRIVALEARLTALEQAVSKPGTPGHLSSAVLPTGWPLVGGLVVGLLLGLGWRMIG